MGVRWRSSRYMGRRILEVGAGIGNMSQWLPVRERLVLTETEPALLAVLHARTAPVFRDAVSRVACCRFRSRAAVRPMRLSSKAKRSIRSCPSACSEHIENDRAAIRAAARAPAIQRSAGAAASSRSSPRSRGPSVRWIATMGTSAGIRPGGSSEISRRAGPRARSCRCGRSTRSDCLGWWCWTTMILKRGVIDPGSREGHSDALCPYVQRTSTTVCRTLRLSSANRSCGCWTLPDARASLESSRARRACDTRESSCPRRRCAP